VPFQFGGYSVDVDRRELRRGAELIDIGPQVFDLLVYLIHNRNRVVSKDDLLDAVWEGRIVSESTLTSRINAVRRAIGDTGADQTLIKTIARKGFRFIGEVEEGKEALPQASAGGAEVAAGRLHQEIHFCNASDGVRIGSIIWNIAVRADTCHAHTRHIDELADALRVAHGIGYADGTTLRDAKQRKPLQAIGVNDALEVTHEWPREKCPRRPSRRDRFPEIGGWRPSCRLPG